MDPTIQPTLEPYTLPSKRSVTTKYRLLAYKVDANAWFSRLGVRKEENVLASWCRDVLGCGRMKRGEVGRLGVRRQETGEQGSPSECRRDKKEREGKPLHYQLKENRERSGVGVGYVEGSHKATTPRL